MSEPYRRVLMDECVFLSLIEDMKKARPGTVVQVRWPELPVVEMVTHWEPIITVILPDTPPAVEV